MTLRIWIYIWLILALPFINKYEFGLSIVNLLSRISLFLVFYEADIVFIELNSDIHVYSRLFILGQTLIKIYAVSISV